jgi:hypothetical protein
MDIYRNTTKKLNRYTKSATLHRVVQDNICLVDKVQPGIFRIISTAREAQEPPSWTTFVEVLHEWGCSWLWEHMSIKGGTGWIACAITNGSLVAVTDGSYIRQIYPYLCSAAFVLECSHGRGGLIGLFKETSKAANAYRGELQGLMTIHLLLVSVNCVHKSLSGSAKVVSNCLGALHWVTYLPPYQIPSRCKHLDILKNLLVNCWNLMFSINYSHVKAHQDNTMLFKKLSRSSQLNCICDHLAKQRLSDGEPEPKGSCLLFPLEPIGITVGGEKLSSETGPLLQFHTHCQLARNLFHWKGILLHDKFGEVDWELVHRTLHTVPRLFQVWAAKHVLGIAGTMKFLAHQDGRDPTCPSCQACEETCTHIARCPEAGCTEAFSQVVAELSKWLIEHERHPNLVSVISEYAQGQGETPCVECAGDLPPVIREFAISQDKIGWGNFIVGMISTKLLGIQDSYLWVRCLARSSEKWATGLITQLLQVTHRQWIYRCVLVHDCTMGTLVNQHKAMLLEEITKQLSMGAESPMEDDKFLLECNLSDFATTNGEQQEYWLLAIQAAQKADQLQMQARQQQCTQIS